MAFVGGLTHTPTIHGIIEGLDGNAIVERVTDHGFRARTEIEIHLLGRENDGTPNSFRLEILVVRGVTPQRQGINVTVPGGPWRQQEEIRCIGTERFDRVSDRRGGSLCGGVGRCLARGLHGRRGRHWIGAEGGM